MKISGETFIDAPRERVWAALMDPDVLARAIDGVESLEKTDDGKFRGTMNAKVGPVRAKFTGEAEIREADEPTHYVLAGEGKGGVAGFAKGEAVVDLEEDGAKTLLKYTASSQVGGKLAQLGARLVEGAAKGYAERFFQSFKAIVEDGVPAGSPDISDESAIVDDAEADAASAATTTVGTVDAAEPYRSSGSGLGMLGWGTIVVLVAGAIIALQFID